MKTTIAFTIVHFSLLIVNCYSQQPGWEIIPSGTNTQLNSVFFYDYEVGFACGDSGIVIKSVDSGKTWSTSQTPVTNDLNDLYMFHRDTIMVVGDSGAIFFSDNGGISWSGNNYMEEDILSVSFSDGNGVCGCISQTILYCEYSGTSLTCMTVQSGFFGGGFWGAHMLSPEIGFVAGENSIFQPLLGWTTDSGINWDFTAFYLNNNEGRATGVDFTDINTGYISASVWNGQGAIAKTTNGGSNWSSTLFTNPLWDVDFPISGASQIGYAVGSEGTILKTYDAGSNWFQKQSGTTLKLNKVHFLDLDFGFAVGENGTILKTKTGGEPVTNVDESTLTIIEFRLEQNYPNPFNPTTKIKFEIPGQARNDNTLVTLKIYDILGSEIATLVNEVKTAGEYEIGLNATGVTSGIYFYTLTAGNFSATKKLVLLK